MSSNNNKNKIISFSLFNKNNQTSTQNQTIRTFFYPQIKSIIKSDNNLNENLMDIDQNPIYNNSNEDLMEIDDINYDDAMEID
jgi:hypothetical protein